MTIAMILFVVVAISAYVIATDLSSDESAEESLDHSELEEAWRIQEITDAARQDMYREVRRSVGGGEGE